MLQVIDYRALARLFTLLGAVLFALFSAVSTGESLVATVRAVILISSLIVIALLALNATGIWRRLWRRVPFLTRAYPDIQGTYRGQIVSNFKSREAGQAKSDIIKPITLRVFTSLFSVDVRMETDDDYSSSQTLVVNAVRRVKADAPKLRYLYRNWTKDPETTDESFHLGAGEVEIIDGTPMRLSGVYWTNRCWRNGLNTAGTIEVTRISPDPDYPVPQAMGAVVSSS